MAKIVFVLLFPFFSLQALSSDLTHEIRPVGFSRDSKLAYEWVDHTCICAKNKCEGSFGESCEPRGLVVHNLLTDKTEAISNEDELKSRKGIILGKFKLLNFPLVFENDSIATATPCKKDLKDPNKVDQWNLFLTSKKYGSKKIGTLTMASGLGNSIAIEGYILSPYSKKIAVVLGQFNECFSP